MNKTIRDRLEMLLAKIAGKDVDIKAVRPSIPTDLKEELMLDIAARLDRIEKTGGGSPLLEDLTDVNVNTVSDGQTITYNSKKGEWVNTDVVVPTLPDLGEISDVDVLSPSEGQVLTYDAASKKWKNTSHKSWELYTVATGEGYCSIDNIEDNGITGVIVRVMTDGGIVPDAIGVNLIISKGDDALSVPLRSVVNSNLTQEEVVAEFMYTKDANLWTGKCTNGYDMYGNLADRCQSDICLGNYIILNGELVDYSDYSVSEISVSLDDTNDLSFSVQVLFKK